MNAAVRVNKHTATLFTFFLSALVHELVMWCIFKKLRGYLLFMQMLQLPCEHPKARPPPFFLPPRWFSMGLSTIRHANPDQQSGAAEQDKVDEGQEDAGQHQLLARHIYWPLGSVLPLLDTVRGSSSAGNV